MTQRTFTPEDQQAFGRLSGDYNPLHLDPVAARRLIFGRQIVHGLHAALWALDGYFDAKTMPIRLLEIKANFQSGIGVGETVRCSYDLVGEDKLEIRIVADKEPAAWIQVSWENCVQQPQSMPPAEITQKSRCRQRPIEELKTASGKLPLFLDRKLTKLLFPNLAKVLPPLQLSELLATTRLVGMECPGLHSIFSACELAYSPPAGDELEMAYQVVTCSAKLSLLLMTISAPGVEGKIKSFLRPPIHRQAGYTDICGKASPEEFAEQRAIIVGGSRGLGEVAAKLLAAGGAEVIITYFMGEADAGRVVEEITANGGRASCQRLNVLERPEDLQPMAAARGSEPLYLYYFATPFIFGGAKNRFSTRRFRSFCNYYVTGFSKTVEALLSRKMGLEKIFYPSSTAIDEMPPDMGEYAAAKAAGENLCDFLQKANPGLRIYRPRLPRLATDQTASLLPAANKEPVELILTHLRKLLDL